MPCPSLFYKDIFIQKSVTISHCNIDLDHYLPIYKFLLVYLIFGVDFVSNHVTRELFRSSQDAMRAQPKCLLS